jgi:phospholipid transport system substrate-binding protein
MQRLARYKFVVFVVGLLCLSAGRVEAASGPSDAIHAFYAELLDTMRNAEKLGVKGRYEKLEPAVLRTFDLPFMTRLSVGASWAHLQPEQKQRAWKAFARYVTATYATRFDGYSGEEFRVLGEQQIKHGILVRTHLVKSDGESIPINYVTHDNDIGWQVRDVYLAGTISQLATQRSEFSSILRSEGIEGLIALLDRKADDLQG